MVAFEDSIIETESQKQNIHTNKTIFHVDAEHTGIRAVGCFSLFTNAIGLFLLAGIFTNLPAVLVIVGSLVLASALSYSLEKFLINRWTSGRTLELSEDTIALVRKGKVEREIDPQQQVNVLTWNFTVQRSARVKKGWHVVGMALEQEGDYIPVYTFASPEDFEKLALSDQFTTLRKEDKSKKEKMKSVGNMRLAGEQRRLHEAEYDRSIFGAELPLSQFTEYIEQLQKNFPKWMIS